MRCDNTGSSPARLAYLATGARSAARFARPLRDEPLFEELEPRQHMAADLAVTGISFLPGNSVAQGATVSASLNYRNAGNAMSGAATLRIVLSDNSTYGDGDDVQIFTGAQNGIPALAAGGVQHVTTNTFALDPNFARAGSYYLIAHLTPAGADDNAANNTFYSLTRVVITIPAPAIDLTNTTTVTGGTFLPGATFTGTITARNQGAVAIGEDAWVRYALSVDSIWGNEDDIAVTSPTGMTFATLNAGQSSTVPLSFAIPGNTPNGSYRLLSMIDWDRNFAESNEANNAYAQPLANIVVARPDLQGTITAPATITAGSTISPAFTIRNAGGIASNFAHFTIALRPIGATDASQDTPVLGNGYIPPLAAGASSTVAAGSFAVGTTVAAGQYRMVVILDVLTEVAEGNEANNTVVASTITTITNPAPAAQPDLTVSILPLTATVLPGDVLDPLVRVNNLGAVGGAPYAVRLFLSTNATLDASDFLISGFTAPVAGLSIQFQPGALVPTWIPGGNYYLIAQTDADSAVAESNENNNTGATATASITVVRPVISISATDPAATEVTAPGTPNIGVFTITRTGPTTQPLDVNFSLGGTATEGTDYATIPHLVTIPAGATSRTFTISVTNDDDGEPIETVIATLARGTGYSINLSQNVATVNIADNEPLITVAATDPTAAETTAPVAADGGRFTFTRTGPTTNPLTITYTMGGTAVPGIDYTGPIGTVTFLAGSSTAVVNVASIDDSTGEPAETVVVTVVAGVGYAPGLTASATVTINDNEPFVTITATDAAAAQTREGTPANPGQFRFTRTGPTTDPLTVNFSIGGTAVNGLDYRNADTDLMLANQVIIPAGQTSVVVNIAPRVVARPGSMTVILTPTFGAGEAYRVASPAIPATVTITTLPSVDLAVDGFQTGTTPVSLSAPHATTSFSYVFYNAGLPSTTIAPFTIQIRLSSNNILGDADDMVVFTRAYAAGFNDSGLVTGEIDWDLLPQVVPGTYHLGLFLDSGGVINELNEINNRVFSENSDLIFTP